MDALLTAPARFIDPLWAWIRARPVYILFALFIALVLLALVSV
jgi:dolichyl-phosphate beta-glucosyltransferase